MRVLQQWIRPWSRKFQLETLIRTDLTKSLAQSNNLRDESYDQSGLVCESYNLKHFKPPWSQCKQLRATVYKLRNVIYIYKFKVSLKTMESGSCQYGRVTMIFFIKASSNNRFAVFIGTAFQGKTRSKDTGSTIYLWRWINIAIVMFYLSCKGNWIKSTECFFNAFTLTGDVSLVQSESSQKKWPFTCIMQMSLFLSQEFIYTAIAKRY